jgi:hypothetical protein
VNRSVSGDIRTGHATLGQLEARVSAEITVMVEQLEAVIRYVLMVCLLEKSMKLIEPN